MPTQQEKIIELYLSGNASDSQMKAIKELANRGLVQLPATNEELGATATAKETGALAATGIGYGKGTANVLRGVGIMDEETPSQKAAISALKQEHPIATTIGEIAGETAPFLIPGTQIGKIPSFVGRVGAGGGLGGLEGGILASGTGQDVAPGSIIGAGIGMAAEAFFPFVGRYARNLYRKVRGREPQGALLKPDGTPSEDFLKTLDEAGVSYNDLLEEVKTQVSQLPPGSSPEQAARYLRGQQEGIDLSTGSVTKKYGQEAVEQRLFESTQDPNAEPFRQFKLKQSEQIKSALNDIAGFEPDKEQTGKLVKDALEGKYNLSRTEKNQLYKEMKNNAKSMGGVPIFTDNIKEAIPDFRTMRSLAVTKESEIGKLNKVLREYGILDADPENLPEFYEPLNLENFDTFRKTLNNLEREDQTGTMSVAIHPIREALDREIDEFVENVSVDDMPYEILEPLKKARKIVGEMKTEFDPKGLVGQLIETKNKSELPIIEASKAYDKIIAKSQPIENVRRTVNSLRNAGPDGASALRNLQASTVFDLLEAGFGTESRQVDGVRVFNPDAFLRKMKNIGNEKLQAIFADNHKMFKRLTNIREISKDLMPPSGAVPKGSATVMMDIANRIGLTSLTAKLPGGAMLAEGLTKLAQGAKSRAQVKEAMEGRPQIIDLATAMEKRFPGVAAALGVSASSDKDDNKK